MSYSKLALLIGAGATLLSFGGVFSDTLELLSHWRVQFLILAVAIAVLVSIHGTRRIQAAALALCLLNAWPIAQHVERTAPRLIEGADSDSLSILTANLFSGRVDQDALRSMLAEADPDIALFTEVSPDSEILIRESLPNHGLAWIGHPHLLFSSLIAVRGQDPAPAVTYTAEGDQYPWARLEACFESCLSIIALHAAQPPGLTDKPWRNRQFRQILDHVAQAGAPDLMLGDLNLSPWAPAFAGLTRDTGLRDTAPEFEINNTWPRKTPGLGIRIDHILVSGKFGVLDYTIGPDLSSDHRPVLARIARLPPS